MDRCPAGYGPGIAKSPSSQPAENLPGAVTPSAVTPSAVTPGAVTPSADARPAEDNSGSSPAVATLPAATQRPRVHRTRTSATYAGVATGLVVLVVVIVFIAQNLDDATVHFVTANFRMPVGLLILAAAVAGGLVILLVSLARVAQLRLMARRHRRAHQPPDTGLPSSY